MDGGMYQNGKMQKQTSTEQNIEENALKRFKEAENAYREYMHKPIYVGNGILDQIKPAEPITLKVEDLYEGFSPNMWPLLDKILKNRLDLHDRIEKFKRSKRSNI